MYNAVRNVYRALIHSKRTDTGTNGLLEAPRKEVKLGAAGEQSAPSTAITTISPPQWLCSVESDETNFSTDHVPTHICANCGEDFCDEIEWKEHNGNCTDIKQTIECFACLKKGCNFLCSNEDDLKVHTQHAHEGAIQLVPVESDTNNAEFEPPRDAVLDHTHPFHCKEPEGNPKASSEDFLADTKLGLEPDGKTYSETPTSRRSSTEATCSSQHATLHSSVEDCSMQSELLEPIVTKFLKEMLDKAMLSFDMSFSRTSGICAEDESDLDSDGFEEYDVDTEQLPANRALDIASSIYIQSHSLSMDDETSMRTTSSNTPSEFSTRTGSSESGSSSRTPSSSGERKGKGSSRASYEDSKKQRRRIAPLNGENDQENGRESDEDENERVERRRLSDSCTNGKNLACPFYQRRPQQHPKSTACIHPGFKTIARLKEHLYRQHYRISCPRCGHNFEQEDELNIHLKAKVACESTEEGSNDEYMTTQQKVQLRTKKRKIGQDTPEKKWESIYLLLFPDDMPPLPSPYCEPTVPRPISSSSSHTTGFQDFFVQRLRFLVMEKFKSDLRTFTPVIQARLMDSMDEIFREAPAQIHRQWEEQNHTLASPSNRGNNQLGLNSSKSVRKNQAVVDAAIMQAQPTKLGQIEHRDVIVPTAEGGTQGSISISDRNEYFNGFDAYHNVLPDIWSAEGLSKSLVDHVTTAAMRTTLGPDQQARTFTSFYELPFIHAPSPFTPRRNDSFFGPLDFGTDTAVTDKSASQLPGRPSDSPLESLLHKELYEQGYSQNASNFRFEGLATTGCAEFNALNSNLWDLDSRTAQHIAGHNNFGLTSLDNGKNHQASNNHGDMEQPGQAMIGLLDEYSGSDSFPSSYPQ